MRVRFSFKCAELMKYISHLDMMRLFQRALRRSALPVAYSEGYNPHLRFNLALPLPVNVTADMELGELHLVEPVSPRQFLSVVQKQLPEGLLLTSACRIEEDAPPLPSLVDSALYLGWPVVEPGGVLCSAEACRHALDILLSREEIWMERPKKKSRGSKKRTAVNVKPLIKSATVNVPGLAGDNLKDHVELRMHLKAGSSGGVSPFIVIDKLNYELDKKNRSTCWKVHRVGLCDKDKELLQAIPGEK